MSVLVFNVRLCSLYTLRGSLTAVFCVFRPVSAYAMFFRDTQAQIKNQNPAATFGEVSKIVAAMWDGLNDDVKQVRVFVKIFL